MQSYVENEPKKLKIFVGGGKNYKIRNKSKKFKKSKVFQKSQSSKKF